MQAKASLVTVCSSSKDANMPFLHCAFQAQVNTSVQQESKDANLRFLHCAFSNVSGTGQQVSVQEQSEDANLPAARYAAGPMCH